MKLKLLFEMKLFNKCIYFQKDYSLKPGKHCSFMEDTAIAKKAFLI